MDPDLQAFFSAFGRFPQNDFEFQSFKSSGVGAQSSLGPIFGPPDASQLPSIPQGGGEFIPGLGGGTGEPGVRTFQPELARPFPDAAARRGGGVGGLLPGGPGPIFGPDPLGAPEASVGGPFGPVGFPTEATPASGSADLAGIGTRLSALEATLQQPGQDVARARLGGAGAGRGFSFSGGGAAPPPAGPSTISGLAGPQTQGLPPVGPTGSGLVLDALGRQQQADVANQQKVAADALGSLLGGIGGIGGLLGGGGGGGGGSAPAAAPGPNLPALEDKIRRASLLNAGGLGRV